MRRGYAFVLLQLLVLGNGNLFESAGAEEPACQGNLYLLLLPKCPINIKFILSHLKIQDSSAFAYGVYPCTLADFTPLRVAQSYFIPYKGQLLHCQLTLQP